MAQELRVELRQVSPTTSEAAMGPHVTLVDRPPEKGGLIPAIAVTAFYEEFVVLTARAAGFDAYLTKPINFEALCMLVDHVAGIKRQRDDSAAWTGSPPIPSVASFEKPRPATARNTADQGEP